MNTIFHVLDDEFELVATVLFKEEPSIVLGKVPSLGQRVWIGPPFNRKEAPYKVVGIAEEVVKKAKACALRLKPERALNS